MATKSCAESAGTPDLTSLLISKGVDLVLQSDEHTYQRSKQLVCAEVDLYRPDCVVDDGFDDVYQKGAGTVFVVSGTFGRSLYEISALDPEAGYFAKAMGERTTYGSANTGTGYGFVRYTVAASRIDAEFVLTRLEFQPDAEVLGTRGTPFSDSFSIGSPPVGPEPATISPAVILESLLFTSIPLVLALPFVVAGALFAYFLGKKR
jgi:hypothetical protein